MGFLGSDPFLFQAFRVRLGIGSARPILLFHCICPLASTARCALPRVAAMAPGSPSRPPGSPSRPDVPYPSRYARRPSAAQLEETIAEQSDLLTWITTGIFILSLFSSIVRSDPTMPICLFGFYGAPLALADHMRQCLHLSHRTWLPPSQELTCVPRVQSVPSGSSCLSRFWSTASGCISPAG